MVQSINRRLIITSASENEKVFFSLMKLCQKRKYDETGLLILTKIAI